MNNFNITQRSKVALLITLALVALLLVALSALAATYTIFDVTNATGNVDLIAPSAVANVTISNLTRGPGVTKETYYNSANGGFLGSKDWTTGASRDVNDYLQFTVTPNAGYETTYTSLTYAIFVQDGSASYKGPQTWELRYSTDGFASDDNLLATHTSTYSGSDKFIQTTFTTNISVIGRNVSMV